MPERVSCPFCNHRLFDLWSNDVKLDIKCPKCKKIVSVLKTKYVHTEQRNQAV